METFDYKPKMKDMFDKDLPESIRQGQRLTTMTSGQSRFPIAPSIFKFAQYGKSGAWVSELLPYTARMVDDIAIIRSMHTDAINHEPAITFFQTGFMIAGRPCIGAWLSYGLGSMNENLPAFVVLQANIITRRPTCRPSQRAYGAPVSCSGKYSGVSLRSSRRSVLFINNPTGRSPKYGAAMLDGLPNESASLMANWAILKPKRASPSTRWLSGCKLRARTDRLAKSRQHLGTVWRRCATSPAHSRRPA